MSKEHWNLDDDGRLYRAMVAHSQMKSDWHGLPPATTRGAKAGDRLLNGIIVILHLGIAAAVGAFALATLGYIDVPDKGPVAPVTVTKPTLPAIGSDVCG